MPLGCRRLLINFPLPQRMLVSPKDSCQLFSGQPVVPTMREQLFAQGYWRGVRVIAKELDDVRPLPDGWFGGVSLPQQVRPDVDFEAGGYVFLSEAHLVSSSLQMFAKRLRILHVGQGFKGFQ